MRAELLKQDQDVIDRVNQFPKDDPGLSDKKKAAEVAAFRVLAF